MAEAGRRRYVALVLDLETQELQGFEILADRDGVTVTEALSEMVEHLGDASLHSIRPEGEHPLIVSLRTARARPSAHAPVRPGRPARPVPEGPGDSTV